MCFDIKRGKIYSTTADYTNKIRMHPQYLKILENHAENWPGLCCWWCTEKIPKDKPALPCARMSRTQADHVHMRRSRSRPRPRIRLNSGRYELSGFFCCVACIKAFCLDRGRSFAETRAFLAERGLYSWRERPVRPASSHLLDPKFGPPTVAQRRYAPRRRGALFLSSPCACRCGDDRRRKRRAVSADGSTQQPLRRRNRRHGGAGTLVPWLQHENVR